MGHGVLVWVWQRLWGGGGPRRCGMGVLLGRWGNRAPGVLRGWLWGPGRGAHIAPDHPTADSGRGEQPAVMRRCVVGWAWPTHDPFGPQAVNLPDSSPYRTMARRTGHLRSFFGRATTHHTRTHNPRRFCRRSGAMSSITTPPGVFRRSAPKNTSPASRTSVTPRTAAGTLAQPKTCTNTSPCQRVSCLVDVWMFESARGFKMG